MSSTAVFAPKRLGEVIELDHGSPTLLSARAARRHPPAVLRLDVSGYDEVATAAACPSLSAGFRLRVALLRGERALDRPPGSRRRGGAGPPAPGWRRARRASRRAAAAFASGAGYMPVDQVLGDLVAARLPDALQRVEVRLDEGREHARVVRALEAEPPCSARSCSAASSESNTESHAACLPSSVGMRRPGLRGELAAVRGVVGRERRVDLGLAAPCRRRRGDRAAPTPGRCRSSSPSQRDRAVAQGRDRARAARRCEASAAKNFTNWNCASLPASAACASCQSASPTARDASSSLASRARRRRRRRATSCASVVRMVVDSVSRRDVAQHQAHVVARRAVSASRVASQAAPQTRERASGLVDVARGARSRGQRGARRGGSWRRRGRRR